MKYGAKMNKYHFYEDQGTQDAPDFYDHTWTVGKEYEVNIDSVNLTAQFESDTGTTQILPILNAPQEVLMNTFGVDIAPEIEKAIERDKQ